MAKEERTNSFVIGGVLLYKRDTALLEKLGLLVTDSEEGWALPWSSSRLRSSSVVVLRRPTRTRRSEQLDS